jgi:hypothetical protein
MDAFNALIPLKKNDKLNKLAKQQYSKIKKSQYNPLKNYEV